MLLRSPMTTMTTVTQISDDNHGCQIWHSNWIILAEYGTNLGLFKISFNTASQNVLKLILKSPRFVSFGGQSDPIWSANLSSLMTSVTLCDNLTSTITASWGENGLPAAGYSYLYLQYFLIYTGNLYVLLSYVVHTMPIKCIWISWEAKFTNCLELHGWDLRLRCSVY